MGTRCGAALRRAAWISGRRPGWRGPAFRLGRTMTFDNQPLRPEPADRDAAAVRRGQALRAAIGERLLVADGAMGSMLQGSPTPLDHFPAHAASNHLLN